MRRNHYHHTYFIYLLQAHCTYIVINTPIYLLRHITKLLYTISMPKQYKRKQDTDAKKRTSTSFKKAAVSPKPTMTVTWRDGTRSTRQQITLMAQGSSQPKTRGDNGHYRLLGRHRVNPGLKLQTAHRVGRFSSVTFRARAKTLLITKKQSGYAARLAEIFLSIPSEKMYRQKRASFTALEPCIMRIERKTYILPANTEVSVTRT